MKHTNNKKKKLTKMERIVRFISIAMVVTIVISLIITLVSSINSFF